MECLLPSVYTVDRDFKTDHGENDNRKIINILLPGTNEKPMLQQQ
jgi:hypothetical protein